MSPEQRRGVQDAMTALAKIPGYSGAAIVLFTNNFRDAQVAKHGVRDHLADEALLGTLTQRQIQQPSIVVPAGHQNRSQRRHDGGG